MNIEIVQKYIERYKAQFGEISTKELYKWKAVKQFQDNWDIDAADFYGMLKLSFKRVSNLMDSGKYFPKRMLLFNTEFFPEKMRILFRELYNEEKNIFDRIREFKSEFEEINKLKFPDKKSYQDDRAVIVYLSLKYPNEYFFYKYEMFKPFVEKIQYPFKVSRGNIENVSQFLSICENLKPFLAEDQELLRLHNSRLTEDCFIDSGLHILTQDFIYASVKYLNVEHDTEDQIPVDIKVETAVASELGIFKSPINFNTRKPNYEAKNKKNKRIGDLGELFVVNYEISKLEKANLHKLTRKIKHSSVEEGDGLGYDILSLDIKGNEMFIEVKTTKGALNTPFFMTRNELEWSKKKPENYFIYRVYNFNEKTLSGDLLIISGDASDLCVEPVNYKVNLKK